MSDALKQRSWSRPAAMAIPKGGFFTDKVEQGRYGPIFPKTPACYGFSILALVHRALAYALNHVMPDKMVLHARCASARSSLKPPLEPPLLPL